MRACVLCGCRAPVCDQLEQHRPVRRMCAPSAPESRAASVSMHLRRDGGNRHRPVRRGRPRHAHGARTAIGKANRPRPCGRNLSRAPRLGWTARLTPTSSWPPQAVSAHAARWRDAPAVPATGLEPPPRGGAPSRWRTWTTRGPQRAGVPKLLWRRQLVERPRARSSGRRCPAPRPARVGLRGRRAPTPPPATRPPAPLPNWCCPASAAVDHADAWRVRVAHTRPLASLHGSGRAARPEPAGRPRRKGKCSCRGVVYGRAPSHWHRPGRRGRSRRPRG
jgi:hypothetical protein